MSELLKEIQEHYLDQGLDAISIPEWGVPKKGKVRDIYFQNDNVVMITNDRVSAFDFILPNLIPFKGQVLNKISEYTMAATSDIVPNALISSPDPSIVVQKKMKNLNVECIVRAYLWGSMAGAYEKGERTFCGISLPEGLKRFQKLDEWLFTPTTKAEVGHDENMTMSEVEDFIGKDLAAQCKEISFKLFERGSQLMKEKGLILLDTKYEFGVDENGKLHVIDEVNTPDSSRMCSIEEYEKKYPLIVKAMESEVSSKTGEKFKLVGDLLKEKPEFKIKEYSKQYVRDTLLEMGFDPETAKSAKKLSPETVAECSARYINVCEMITGEKFILPKRDSDPKIRVEKNLMEKGFVSTGIICIMAGSDSDAAHIQGIKDQIQKLVDAAGGSFKVAVQVRICSAHKQPSKLESVLRGLNDSIQPVVIIACAGGTDALSGTASFLSVHPVVSCPPDGMENRTCITNPPGSSNAFCVKPSNAARFALQLLSSRSPAIPKFLLKENAKKISALEKADDELWTGEGESPSDDSKEIAPWAGAESGTVVIMAGSNSDLPHIRKIEENCVKFGLPVFVRICSAHKQPGALEYWLKYYNSCTTPVVIVACAGGTDALSGTASFHSIHPVVSCPPDGLINSTCLTNPPGSSNGFVAKPANVARFAAQVFSWSSSKTVDVKTDILNGIEEKISKLVKADNEPCIVMGA